MDKILRLYIFQLIVAFPFEPIFVEKLTEDDEVLSTCRYNGM